MIKEVIESLYKRINTGDVKPKTPKDTILSILSDRAFVQRMEIAEKENLVAYYAIERAMGKWIRAIENIPDDTMSVRSIYLVEVRDLLFVELGRWKNNHRN